MREYEQLLAWVATLTPQEVVDIIIDLPDMQYQETLARARQWQQSKED